MRGNPLPTLREEGRGLPHPVRIRATWSIIPGQIADRGRYLGARRGPASSLLLPIDAQPSLGNLKGLAAERCHLYIMPEK